MRILTDLAQLDPKGRPVALAIGVFDGVHLGHQQVLRQTLADARRHSGLALAVTFDRHPAATLAPERAPRLIYSLAQKLNALAAIGIDCVWIIPFDLPFSQRAPEEFIRTTVSAAGRVCSLCVGAAFTFGRERSGNVGTLQKLGAELGFAVHGIASVALDGQTVSSTRVRQLVQDGDLDAASQMLGRPFAAAGRVVRGAQRGTALGFPTANLDVEGRLLPPSGVYAALAQAGENSHHAVLNIGSKPTFESAAAGAALEVHLLNFRGDLYGQELEVSFVARLRNEQKFPSADLLRSQIQQDIARAREILD